MRQDAYDDMLNNKFTTDPKEQLWQAVHNVDLVNYRRLVAGLSKTDINKYCYGITLLHALVLSDTCDNYIAKEIHTAKAEIAKDLLALGADLYAPATAGAPSPISVGQTPWQMAARFDQLPWYHYYDAGNRASLTYTGEHVLPVFKQHLGIKEVPSMLSQFSSFCTENSVVSLVVLAAAAVLTVKLRDN